MSRLAGKRSKQKVTKETKVPFYPSLEVLRHLRCLLLNKIPAARPPVRLAHGELGRALPIRVIRAIRGEIILAFPRRAFGKRERRVRPSRPDRALKCQRFRISSSLARTKTGL
jgi:hypothetical protein